MIRKRNLPAYCSYLVCAIAPLAEMLTINIVSVARHLQEVWLQETSIKQECLDGVKTVYREGVLACVRMSQLSFFALLLSNSQEMYQLC